MSGLGGAINWDGRPVTHELMGRLMGVVAHRGPDGLRWEAVGQVGLGHGLLALRRVELEQPTQPVWLPDRSAAVVADCRLDNRGELRRALGTVPWFGGAPSDAELILAAYERWGTELVQRLIGDFAFAVWDAARRRLVAARDPFGVRPLFFHWSADRFIFASEPKQILVLPEIPVEVDDVIVGEYLFRKFEDLDRTFFTSVRRLPAAHRLVATAVGVETRRYWNPDPTVESRFDDPQQAFDHFRERFIEAVRVRLRTDFPVTAHLSGGHDSSSVVVAAGELSRGLAGKLPPIAAVSLVFPGLECDESAFIQAVASRLPFAVHTVNPLGENVLDGLLDDLWRIDSPFGDLQRGGRRCVRRMMGDVGARTLLTGLGGDELVHEQHYLRDLAIAHRFVALLRESWRASRYSWNSFGWLLGDALRPIVPDAVKAARRNLLGRTGWAAPAWANPEFAAFFASCPEVPHQPDPGFPTLVQQWAFRWLNYPGICWALEAVESYGAADGVSLSHPFLDRNLAEYVISIRPEDRPPHGRWKELVRRGLADLLPEELRQRRRKTVFDSFNNAVMLKCRDELERLVLKGGSWHSARYVERGRVVGLFEGLRPRVDGPAVDTDVLWRICTLELWLGQISRYTMCER